MKRITILLFTILIAAAGNAQIIVTLGSALLQNPGTTVHLPVTVQGLNGSAGGKGITGLEFHISYNSGNLTYDTTLNFTQLMPVGQWFFGGNGLEYSTTWQEPSLHKVDIPDNTDLFEVDFHYAGGVTTLTFDTARCFLIDSAYNIISGVQYVNGQVTPSAGSGESRWNGTGSWNSANGWSNGIPGDSTIAIIESGTVTISAAAVSKSLTIQGGTKVIIAPDFSLTVNSTFTNNGELLSRSDETGTGSLIVSGTVAGSGVNRFERFLDTEGGNSHLVSSPVAGAAASVFAGITVEKYIENNAAWATMASGETLNPGTGVRTTLTSPATVNFEGGFPTGDVTTSNLSYTATGTAPTRGLNLAGNPYPSAIRLGQGNWAMSGIDRSVYVWDGYKYLTWNGSFGSLTDGIIPAMQGFFVKSNAAGGTLTVPAGARLHDSRPYYKAADQVQEMISMRLEADDASAENPFDDAFVHLMSGTTGGFDSQEDAWKLDGSPVAPQIWTEGEDQIRLAINTKPDAAAVPVAIRTAVAGACRIVFGNVASFDASRPLFFEDKAANTVVNIRNLADGKYVFASTGSTETGRFYLHFQETGTEEITGPRFFGWNTAETIVIRSAGAQQQIRSISVFNLAGKEVLSVHDVETPLAMNRDHLPSGLYCIRIQTLQGVSTIKMLIR